MDQTQLRIFKMLAETEHVSNTAAELDLSQSTVSNALQRLENELHCRLFTRKGRHICLNEAGRTLLEYAENILEQMNMATEALDELSQQRANLVHISTPSYSSFPNLFTGLNARYPEITLENDSYTPTEMKNNLLSGRLDFCISGIHIENDSLERITLSEDELVIVVNKNHPLSSKKNALLSDFADDRFCDFSKNDPIGSNLMRYARAAGFTPQIDFYVHDINDVFPVIRTTNSPTLIPMRIFEIYAKDMKDIAAVHISEPLCFSHLYLYRKKSVREKNAVKKARTYFTEYFEKTRNARM